MQVAPGGIKLAAAAFVGAIMLAVLSPVLGLLGAAVSLGVLLFHRDPDRTPPARGILAPADGRVQRISKEDDRLRVAMFMNLQHVHVTRTPATGEVTDLVHTPGAHRPAFTKDSERNERVQITLDAPDGEYTVVLIAGAFARRIHPMVEPGDTVHRGDRIGNISFGSRVDVVMPAHVQREDLAITQGDRTYAGETVLAIRDETLSETEPKTES